MVIMRYELFAVVALAAVVSAGCGGQKEVATPMTWSNQDYRFTITYPSTWLVEDVLEGSPGKRTVVTVFHKPPTHRPDELRKRPPMVMVEWVPRSEQPAGTSMNQPGIPDMTRGAYGIPVLEKGLTSGWIEFGAQDIQTRETTWPDNLQGVEATATAQPGTAFFIQYSDQLTGNTQYVRVIALQTQHGHYEITRVVPENLVEEADTIVNSFRLVR